MKKLFVLAIAMVLAFGMNAQKFGVKAGYNMSGYLVNFYVPDGAEMGMGFNAGVLAELDLKVLALRADITFNQLGSGFDSRSETDANWPFRAAGVEYDYKTKVNYLHIGVSPKFNIGPAYVFVGPYLQYAISSNETTTWEGGPTLFTPTPGTGSYDIFSDPNAAFNPLEAYSDDNNSGGTGDLFNKVDVGFNLGLGASFSGVFVEANIGMGIFNFINIDSQYYDATGFATKDDNTVAITGDASQKNLFFGLSVGYMLGK